VKSNEQPARETSAGTRGRPSPEMTRLRQARLLEIARCTFVRRGYHATTMADVAAAAGVTKRTLYAWHADKEALFRACVEAGAARFPRLEPNADERPEIVLERYVIELHEELSREESYGIGLLFMREAAEFPELGGSVRRGYLDYLIEPLALYLRRHHLEEDETQERAMLFVAMALSPLHNKMLMGMPLPDAHDVRKHARRCVEIMFGRGRALVD